MIKFIVALSLGFGAPLARAVDDLGGEDDLAVEREIDSVDEPTTIPNPDLGVRAATPPVPDPSETPPPSTPPFEELPPDEPRGPIVAEPERPSSPRGEKIFDWDKHRGEREVHHPFAEKGLVRITKDKTYLYKVSESEQRRAADFHAGPFTPVNLANPNADGAFSTYEDNYNGGAPALLVNYEWQIWQMPVGKMGLRAGGGLFYSQGHGHFVHDTTLKPLEVFTFIALPLNVGVVYRMQLFHRQLIVPYGEGGGTLWAFGELRDDNKSPKFGGAPAAYVAAGAAFNMTYFNAISRVALDRQYGINAIYVLAEYRGMIGLSKNYDFTASFLNGGILMEF